VTEFAMAAASALWLGILTSISPCPLATNIAAISYVGGRVENTRRVVFAGVLYTLGRTLAYVGLALLLITSVSSVPQVSTFLQRYMHMLLGPLLIVIAVFLLGLIDFSFGSSGISEKLKTRVDSLGIWGALLIGFVFALAFCPTSAALFFGSVMASLQAESNYLLPILYGVGTALPVIAFSLLIAVGSQKLGAAFQAVSRVETWARTITGGTMLAIGIYMTIRYVFLGS
jgi:cytochrome c-type biogenesis protein